MTADGANTWAAISIGTPALAAQYINAVSVNPNNPNDVIACLGGTNADHLWRCANTSAANRVWTDLSGAATTGLPNLPANAIARDPADPVNSLYVATDQGVYATKDGGTTWTDAASPKGLPGVTVMDVQVEKYTNVTYLYAVTFGRGVWRIPLMVNAPVPSLQSVTLNPASVTGGRTQPAP
jgi:hypothetical protein